MKRKLIMEIPLLNYVCGYSGGLIDYDVVNIGWCIMPGISHAIRIFKWALPVIFNPSSINRILQGSLKKAR
jgi:hypothetical protein